MDSAGSPNRRPTQIPLTWTTVPPELSSSGRSSSRKRAIAIPISGSSNVRRELRQRAGLHDRVRVQEDEHIARRLGGAAVAAAREAEVPAGLDQPHTLAPRGNDISPTRCRRCRRRSPQRPAGERAQQAAEPLAGS